MLAVIVRPFRKSNDINGDGLSVEIQDPSRASPTTKIVKKIPTADIFKDLFMSFPKVGQASSCPT
jgi:hypothetical protein